MKKLILIFVVLLITPTFAFSGNKIPQEENQNSGQRINQEIERLTTIQADILKELTDFYNVEQNNKLTIYSMESLAIRIKKIIEKATRDAMSIKTPAYRPSVKDK